MKLDNLIISHGTLPEGLGIAVIIWCPPPVLQQLSDQGLGVGVEVEVGAGGRGVVLHWWLIMWIFIWKEVTDSPGS